MHNNELQKKELETMFQMEFNEKDLKVLKANAKLVDDIEDDLRVFKNMKEFLEWYYLNDKDSIRELLDKLIDNKYNTYITDTMLPNGSYNLSNGKILFNLSNYEVVADSN
ncbi:hypothetical protein [Staphylococcus shinii]|uniref:hypothetical protein n=1 Tax=Staphylococcus shinii TaxID=2912228 RepID=UPI003F5641A7